MKLIGVKMSPVWISITTAVGAYSVSLLSIYLGYLLFLSGATGQFEFSAKAGDGSVGLSSIAPGIAFAFFGMAIAIYATYRLIGKK